MIKALIRLPKRKPFVHEFQSRAELARAMNGVLKGAKVKLLEPQTTSRNQERSKYLDNIQLRGGYRKRNRK